MELLKTQPEIHTEQPSLFEPMKVAVRKRRVRQISCLAAKLPAGDFKLNPDYTVQVEQPGPNTRITIWEYAGDEGLNTTISVDRELHRGLDTFAHVRVIETDSYAHYKGETRSIDSHALQEIPEISWRNVVQDLRAVQTAIQVQAEQRATY